MDSSGGGILVANCYNGVLCSTNDGGSWKQSLKIVLMYTGL